VRFMGASLFVDPDQATSGRMSALHANKIEKQLKKEVQQLLRLAEAAGAVDIPAARRLMTTILIREDATRIEARIVGLLISWELKKPTSIRSIQLRLLRANCNWKGFLCREIS
jgi:hypothetical protein